MEDSFICKEAIKFLMQCHRIAPSVNSIQAAMLFTLYTAENPIHKDTIAEVMRISKTKADRQLRPLMRRQKYRQNDKYDNPAEIDAQLVTFGENFSLVLTERGESFCRGLLTNMRHYFSN